MRVEMKLSEALRFVRLGIVQNKSDIALEILDDVIGQVVEVEKPGGPLGPKEEPKA
jgi:hypothetical protein